MFDNCSSLTTIYVGVNWTTENVTSSGSMFRICTNLVGGNGTTYDGTADKTYARVDEAIYDEVTGEYLGGNKGYLTLKEIKNKKMV